jgi:hypothetical protein
MNPEIGLAATRIALFMIVAGGLTLLMVSPDSAEFVVLVLTIGIGVAMLVAVALLSRMGVPRWAKRPKRDEDAAMSREHE